MGEKKKRGRGQRTKEIFEHGELRISSSVLMEFRWLLDVRKTLKLKVCIIWNLKKLKDKMR